MEDEIWDEHRWEEFIREADARTDRYQRLFEAYIAQNPPPDENAPEAEHSAYWNALHEDLARQMGWDIPRLLDEASDTSDAENAFDDDLFEQDDLALDIQDPNRPRFEDLPLWQQAYDFGMTAYDWARSLPEGDYQRVRDGLVAEALRVAAKIANGSGFGLERDSIGGNIVQCKRALEAANAALDELRRLRQQGVIAPADYLRLYELGAETRNAVGIYIQELRERFERGVA